LSGARKAGLGNGVGNLKPALKLLAKPEKAAFDGSNPSPANTPLPRGIRRPAPAFPVNNRRMNREQEINTFCSQKLLVQFSIDRRQREIEPAPLCQSYAACHHGG
jgi:hypothetical protein